MFTPNSASFEPAEKITLAMEGLNFLPDTGGEGVLAGNLVEGIDGWLPVEMLSRGARVATYDGGFATLTRVERRHIWPSTRTGLIHIPGGALDNCSDIQILPGQKLLIASPEVEDRLDCAGILVPAASLVGYRGIARRKLDRPAEVISLRFATEEMVFVNSGTLVHCGAEGPVEGQGGFFPELGEAEARDVISSLWKSPQPICHAA